MRDHWPRKAVVIDLDSAEIEGIIAPFFPGCRIAEARRVAGGLTNTNIKVSLAGRSAPLLLRIYQRSGELAHKEMALCQRVAPSVSVPTFLHFAPENPVTGHAFAILDWIEAQALDRMLPALNATAISGLAAEIGETLAAIHRFAYDHCGFFDAELNVPEPIDLSGEGLLRYLHECLIEGRGGARLGAELTGAVLAFAEAHGHHVEAWQDRACLVHGDFNLSNILVRRSAGSAGWDIAAIIDWEFAFAGAPGFDFGLLLRPPLDDAEPFIARLAQAYRGAGGEMPDDWRRIAQITDLFSLADILHHPETNAAIIDDAKSAIRKLIAN